MATATAVAGVSSIPGPPSSSSGSAGRPRVEVNREQVEFLRSLSFSWQHIASLMGVSVKTLQRRAQLWGMRSFTDVTNPEVDEMVREFKVNFPNSGEAVLRSYLESRGVHIQRERVRQAVWRINGNEPRLHPPIARRTYSVSDQMPYGTSMVIIN